MTIVSYPQAEPSPARGESTSPGSAWGGAAAPKPIPRRIIQTGKSPSHSVKTRAMVTSLQLLHPDYEYVFFDDARVESFVSEYFPHYRKVYDSFRYPIQKFDFFRYLAVYQYGGFYFDLDVLLGSNLSGLLNYGCVFPFEELSLSKYLRDKCGMDWEIGNYGFGSAPGHPFLAAVIENCVRAQEDPIWGSQPIPRLLPLSRKENYILYTTGPGIVSRTFAEHPQLARQVKILFPDDVCDPRTWHCFGDLGVHMMEASWRPHRGRIQNILRRTFEQRMRRHLMKRSIGFGKLRQQGFVD